MERGDDVNRAPDPEPDRPEQSPVFRQFPGPLGSTPAPGTPEGTPSRPTARPPATWRWWQALLLSLLGTFLGGGVAVSAFAGASEGTLLLAATLAGQVVALVVLVVWLERSHPGWRAVVGVPQRALRELGFGAIAGLLIYVASVFIVGALVLTILELLSDRSVTTPEQLPSDLGGARIVLAGLVALVGAPIVEELTFRGLIFRALRDRTERPSFFDPPWIHGFVPAVVVSSALFALAHYVAGPWEDTTLLVVVMLFVGAVLANLYERRGNIVACIAAHAAFNVVGFVWIVAGG
jgi:hypothetical protein